MSCLLVALTTVVFLYMKFYSVILTLVHEYVMSDDERSRQNLIKILCIYFTSRYYYGTCFKYVTALPFYALSVDKTMCIVQGRYSFD